MNTEAKINNDNKPSAIDDMMMRLGILGELLAYLWKRKLYWLVPMIVALLIVGVLIIVGSANPGSALFVYSLF